MNCGFLKARICTYVATVYTKTTHWFLSTYEHTVTVADTNDKPGEMRQTLDTKPATLRQLPEGGGMQQTLDTKPATLSQHHRRTQHNTWTELTTKKLSGCRVEHVSSFVTEKETGDYQ